MERNRNRRAVLAAGALAVAAGALVGVRTRADDEAKQPFRLLSVDQVERMIGRPDVLVVDANPEDVYRKHHVPGARWWRSRPLAQLLPADKGRPVVFYCASPH